MLKMRTFLTSDFELQIRVGRARRVAHWKERQKMIQKTVSRVAARSKWAFIGRAQGRI
jgi:hypothetical protein